jgi:hypothetical protein
VASLSEEAETLEEGTPPTGQPTKEKVKKDPYLKETTRLMAEYLSMNTK